MLIRFPRYPHYDVFDSDQRRHDLARKSVYGGAMVMGTQGALFVMQLAGLAILARLLTPADYGLIGMVMVVINFAGMFKDAGLPMATVQKDAITREQISSLFWINIAIGGALCLTILAMSPLVGWFYGRPELVPVTALLSLTLLLSGAMLQHQALLRRNMRFGSLAFVQVGAQFVTLLVTVALALMGWGYWALVGGAVANEMSAVAMTYYLCPWIPGRFRRGTGARNMVIFGCHLTGSNFINYLSRNLDNLLIGKFVGAEPLGIYTRAYGLLLLPINQLNSPITRVAIPALSALKDSPRQFRAYYLRALGAIVFFGFPLVTWLFIAADEIILIVLGETWVDSVLIFRILIGAAWMGVTNFAVGWVLIPLGQTGRLVRWNLAAGAATCTAIVVGLHWGLVGVALAVSISHVLLKGPHLWYGYRFSPLTMGDYLGAVAYPFVASVVAGMCAYSLCRWGLGFSDWPIFWRFVALSFAMLVFYLSFYTISRSGRAITGTILKDVAMLFGKRSKG